MWRVSSWLEFTRVSNSNCDSNSTLFRVYRDLVIRTHSYQADFQKTRWLTQLDDFDSSSTRVCQKLRSRRFLLSSLICFTREINMFELSLTDFPVSRTHVRFLKQKFKKIYTKFLKVIEKLESNSRFDSNFTSHSFQVPGDHRVWFEDNYVPERVKTEYFGWEQSSKNLKIFKFGTHLSESVHLSTLWPTLSRSWHESPTFSAQHHQ